MIVVCCILGALLLGAIFVIVRLALQLERLQDLVEVIESQVEESLDVLDSGYKEINTILETPVFFDDPVVKNALNVMGKCRSAILLVANKITTFEPQEEEDEEEE